MRGTENIREHFAVRVAPCGFTRARAAIRWRPVLVHSADGCVGAVVGVAVADVHK